MGRSRANVAKLDTELAQLETLDLESLRARWRSMTGMAAPPGFRVGLLRAAVAYKLQERALGGLKPGTLTLLRRIAEQADPGKLAGLVPMVDRASPDAKPASGKAGSCADCAPLATLATLAPTPARPAQRRPALRIKPGTRLLRTWQGSTHEVLVGQGEVTYRGQRYRSLSEVARTITGQRWSGPLFFGLKGRAVRDPDRAGDRP